MPFNGNGVYSLPAGNPVVSNTTASSTVHNNTNSDIATALTNCVTKDGQSTPTANITLGGFKLTNVGAATSVSDAVIASQIQNNGLTDLSSVSGTNTITATVTPVPSAYATGQVFTFEPANNNTGAATINISSLGAKNIYLNNAPLAADVLVAGQPVVIRYNGTQFEIIGKADFASLNAASQTFAGDVLVNGNTTLGDAAGDSVTFNAAAWSAPNGFAIDTTKLVLDSNSNFGLGVVPQSWSQGQAFEIDGAGNAIWGNSSGDIWMFANAYFNSGNFKYASSSIPSSYIRSGAGTGEIILGTAASGTAGNTITFTEGMRLTNARYFKASNTGAYTSVIGLYHEFNSDHNAINLELYSSSAGSNVINCNSDLISGAAGKHFSGFLNGVNVYNIAANGDVTNTNNSYGAISDRKLKNLLQQKYGDGYYERFKQIQFWTYTLINDPTNQKMLGVVAQELQDIFPGLVDSTPDTEKVEITDEDGNTTTEVRETGTVTLSVKYSVLSLIAAMITQELQFRLDDLTTRIEALEAK